MKLILLVDHDDVSRRAIAARLRDDGHEVLETDETNAMSLCRDGAAAVVVAPSPAPASVPALIGDTTVMRDLRATLRRLGRRPGTNVLVAGERGTGRHAVARALHQYSHSSGELVFAPPDRLQALLEDGLGELGRLGGTLHVPELSDVEKHQQRRLASLLAERQETSLAPVRLVVGATVRPGHVPLERVLPDVAHPELAARLPVVVELVPLRRRRDDIPLVVGHFLGAWSLSSGLPCPRVTPEALGKLSSYGWPGNLRELANVIEHAALSAGGAIDVAHLPPLARDEARIDFELPHDGIDLSALERAVLSQALRLSGGNKTRAASLLGLTRDQIRYRMGKFGLDRR